MKRMADQYFRIDKYSITLSEDPIGNNRLPPLERRRCWGGKQSKGEHLTVTYWGLERRRDWEEIKSSTICEQEEGKKEYLIATYWG